MTKIIKLTPKEQAFVDNRVNGLGLSQSVVAAGYARASASITASKLSKKRAIRDAIAAAKDRIAAEVALGVSPAKNVMQREHYADSKDFLIDLMNHTAAPLAMRADAAKQLLPYQHARIGEKGKKDSAKDIAGKAASEGKFKPGSAPNVTPIRR